MSEVTIEIGQKNITIELPTGIPGADGADGVTICADRYVDDDAAIADGNVHPAVYALAEFNNYDLPQGLLKQINP